MKQFDVRGMRVVIVGAARSGVAAAELLHRRGARVTVTDAKQSLPEAAQLEASGIALELGSAHADAVAGADLVVMSPGVPLTLPVLADARQRSVAVIGELELASRWLQGRLIAITGTKGKSTTTTLVGRMLEQAGHRVLLGGNIGVPLSTQVDASTADTVHVVEASSFQLAATETFHPWIAALLNFSPDHLDWHRDETDYAAAKARVFSNQTATDCAVVNADDRAALRMAETTPARRVRYGVDAIDEAEVFVDRGFIWRRTSEGATPLVPLSAIELSGRHMLSNVAAAAAICDVAGASGAAMVRALSGFRGLEHVMEPVATIDGVSYINDSKATNVEAAARSIDSFENVVAIIGGRYKGGAFADLRAPLGRHGRAVVALGEARPLIRDALAGSVPLLEAESLNDAVRQARALAKPGDVVLLAPACSSFDMFSDYAHRGREFRAVVWQIESESNNAVQERSEP